MPEQEQSSLHQWSRERPFSICYGHPVMERWTYKHGELVAIHHPGVTYGKPFNPLALKQDLLRQFHEKVESVRTSREQLYSSATGEKVKYCPVCGSLSAEEVLEVYKAWYVQCSECNHLYIKRRPTEAALQEFYRTSEDYASTYTDEQASLRRVEEIARPKAEWVLRQFRRIHGRDPRFVLDIGAGGGHFVYACRKLGVEASGLELSKASRMFADSVFGLQLDAHLFDKAYEPRTRPDIITCWGLIEHIPDPIDLLQKANSLLKNTNGMMVASAPNWTSVSSSVQKVRTNYIIRHLDPLGHIHIFTEASLATAFHLTGHGIAAAWYFGMDAYEFCVQIMEALHLPLGSVDSVSQMMQEVQKTIDVGGISDSMVFAGVAGAQTELKEVLQPS